MSTQSVLKEMVDSNGATAQDRQDVMLVNQSIVNALNRQVGEELAAWSQYLAIALYYEDRSLPELAGHFYSQSAEEYDHARRILKYILDAGGHPTIPAVHKPQNEFTSGTACIELSLNQEMAVTREINQLVNLAIEQEDHMTRDFLKWFVMEQLEEVSSMNDLLKVMKMAGEENLLLVEEYLARNSSTGNGANGA